MFIFITFLVGIFIAIIGIAMIFAPVSLAKMNAYLNKKIFTDDAVMSHRIAFAIIVIAVGLLMTFPFFKYGL